MAVDVYSQTFTTIYPPPIGVCPVVEDYEPCSCSGFYDIDDDYYYPSLDCQEKNMGDTKTSQVLNSFLLPSVNYLASVNLTGNQLTRIPHQLAFIYYVMTIDLSFNRLDSIPQGSFPRYSKLKQIYLQNNQITEIAGENYFYCT